MEALFSFLASPAGRVTRIVGGVVLILVGLLAIGGTGGVILAIIGLVPLLAGLLDFCVFAPLAGLPLAGAAIRRHFQH